MRPVWDKAQQLGAAMPYTCGYCNREVASAVGLMGQNRDWGVIPDAERWCWILMCPRCGKPSYMEGERQVPGIPYGEVVEHLPEDVARLYDEARNSIAANSYVAAVLIGRKLLMHVAVAQGAKPGESFKSYVDFLISESVVTAAMREWVDEIRELGNDANHEIPLTTHDEAEALLNFVSMLLKIVYEYPEKGRRSVAARRARQP
jgi:hypothetical protein